MATPPRLDLDGLKARLALSDIVGRHVRLSPGNGDRFGLCPFHDEKGASFTVNDRKGFFHCFGCGAHGDHLDWWQRFEKLSFTEAVERLRREAGGDAPAAAHLAPLPLRDRPRVDQDDPATMAKAAAAQSIWQAAVPIAGTIAETYLRKARKISLPLPECLRFHPGGTDDAAPMMVAAVTNLSGDVVAIQRTYLKPDGSGKAAMLRPKMALGPVGKGAVCLAPAGSTLGIAEGVETGLSAMELFRLPVWCALGSNLARIVMPPAVRNVAIFADHGKAGEAAAARARDAFHEQQRKVSVRFSQSGSDFNDELREIRRRG
jgi:DNA primase